MEYVISNLKEKKIAEFISRHGTVYLSNPETVSDFIHIQPAAIKQYVKKLVRLGIVKPFQYKVDEIPFVIRDTETNAPIFLEGENFYWIEEALRQSKTI